jgi:rhodanese-related sulfurtransferase
MNDGAGGSWTGEGRGDRSTSISDKDNEIKSCDKADSQQLHQVNILYGNVRSILNKMLEFRALVFERKPSIILLCETFVREDIADAFLSVQGYDCVVRQDGWGDTEGGKCRGLLI